MLFRSGDLGPWSQILGIVLLLINLGIDGATNSTQDEIFARFTISGQQMMFWINVFNTLLTTTISVLPLPHIPVLHETTHRTEIEGALAFVRAHPACVTPIVQFAFTGALGQLFIFETLQHFGSLTLVYVASSSSFPLVCFLHMHPVSTDVQLTWCFPGDRPCASLCFFIQDNHAHAEAFHNAAVRGDIQPQVDHWPMGGSSSRIRGHLSRSMGQTARYVFFLTVSSHSIRLVCYHSFPFRPVKPHYALCFSVFPIACASPIPLGCFQWGLDGILNAVTIEIGRAHV